MLPEYIFEWIGRAVAERLDRLEAEHKVELAGGRATIAELRAYNAELQEQVRKRMDDIEDAVGKRLDELRGPSEISEEEFARRIDAAMAVEPTVKQQPVNVTVPIHFPKKGKEVMTVELDEQGRIKRSIKEEVDGEPDL